MDILQKLIPVVLYLAVLFVIMFAVMRLTQILQNAFNVWRYPEYSRKLSEAENGFIVQQALRLAEFRDTNHVPKRYRFWPLATIPALLFFLFASMILNLTLLTAAQHVLGKVFPRTQGDIILSSAKWSSLAWIMVGTFLFAGLAVNIARRSPAYIEFIALQKRRRLSRENPEIDVGLEQSLTHFVRKRRLDPNAEYSVRDLTHIMFERYTPIIPKALKFFVGLSLILFGFDLLHKETYTQDRLQHRPYFSFKTQEYPYAFIQKMRPVCHLYHEKSKEKAWLDYQVSFKDGLTMGYLNGVYVRSDIKALKRMYGFASGKASPLEISASKGYKGKVDQSTCLALATQQYDPKDYKALMTLLVAG